ncbi:MAG: hypothetical protein L3K18_09680 [Thermoplasmata archaeon]|nr:hypothetical protein [Thermoplasmata archaeon]
MAEQSAKDFKAPGLTPKEWNRVEDVRRNAERKSGQSLTNKELLLLLVGDRE